MVLTMQHFPISYISIITSQFCCCIFLLIGSSRFHFASVGSPPVIAILKCFDFYLFNWIWCVSLYLKLILFVYWGGILLTLICLFLLVLEMSFHLLFFFTFYSFTCLVRIWFLVFPFSLFLYFLSFCLLSSLFPVSARTDQISDALAAVFPLSCLTFTIFIFLLTSYVQVQ